MSKAMTRIRAAGPGSARARDLLAPHLHGAEIVGDDEKAELVLMTADDFAEAVEDAAAEAAFQHTREQESIPDAVMGRLLAGENRVKVWREFRGFGLNELASKSGIGRGFLSQVENGTRVGTAATLRKLATALSVDVDDLIAREWGE